MKLTLVLVLYKQKPEESKTFLTLKQTLLSKNLEHENVEVIIYDNSPEKQSFDPRSQKGIDIRYVHDPRNLGIVPAYNYAWSAAKENGSEWLLLLDHDTELTDSYMNEVLNLPEIG